MLYDFVLLQTLANVFFANLAASLAFIGSIHNEILPNPASNSPGHRQSSKREHVLTHAD